MSTTLHKTNRYAAKCVRCGGQVAAEEGLLARTDDGRWAADHPAAECPDKPVVAAIPVRRVASPGAFQTPDGTIYRVQTARGSGKLYAKVWVPNGTAGHFDYAAGAVHRLTERDRMTAEQAAAFGRLYAACVYCMRELTDSRSASVGYGAICASKYGLPWG